MMKRLLFTLFISTFAYVAFAQQQDTVTMQPVQITAEKLVHTLPGAYTITLDTSLLQTGTADMATLLQMHATAFVKSYSFNGTATLSVRGTEARHSAVLWNGINLNSASLGLTDLSLLSPAAFNNVTLLYGGASGVFGNGAIGGTLVLGTAAPPLQQHERINAGFSYGSFGQLSGFVSGSFGSKDISSKTTLIVRDAKNDFKYRNTALQGQPEQVMQHNTVSSFSLLQEVNVKTGKHGSMEASAWYQINDREIPPTMVQTENNATQKDSSLRLTIAWFNRFNHSDLEIRTAFMDEFQDYDNQNPDVHYDYNMRSFYNSARVNTYIGKNIQLINQVKWLYNRPDIAEYSGTSNRSTFTLLSGVWLPPWKNGEFTLSVTKEFTNEADAPFCPAFYFKQDVIKNKLALFASGRRNYTLPAMNDLYWVPGGDPDLKTESSWGADLGIRLSQNNHWYPTVKITGYYSVTQNWIKWTPDTTGLYQAVNLNKVKCTGVDVELSWLKTIVQYQVAATFNYSYVRSENYDEDQRYFGKQLIYIPRHVAVAALGVSRAGYEVTVEYNYTGMRYTLSDNSTHLDPFEITNLKLGKTFRPGKQSFYCYIHFMNLLNSEYQTVAWRPMPGRWFLAGITYNFIKSK